MVPLFFLAQRELLDGLFRSFLLAFVLIAVLMVVVLRSAGGGLLAMLPNLFPAAVVFGFMGLFALKLDIGSMLTASAAMGIAGRSSSPSARVLQNRRSLDERPS